MKKVFIVNLGDRFVCHIEEVGHELPPFKDVLVASFDVSQVLLNVN